MGEDPPTCRQSTEYYKEIALLVARDYYFMPATESSTEKWFKFLGEGWELCKCDAKIVKTINEKMTDLKNNTRVRLSKLPEDTCVEERYLDYFPSMRIAAETMKWICEASEGNH